MSNTIEQLELEITSNVAGASAGIDALADSLSKLRSATKGGLGLKAVAQGIKGINDADVSNVKGNVENLVDALTPLSALSKSNLSSFITPLKNLPKVFTELNNVDMGAFAAKIQEVATAMKPLADEMDKVARGFDAFPAKIQRLLKSTDKVPSSNKKMAGSFTDLYNKIKSGWYVIEKFTKTIWSSIEKSNDYIENVNLFTVSMGEYAGEAMKYGETVSDAMGIDTSEWIRNQGIFMTMATGFGVASDRAATMSKNLTQLGYDLSSFYNMDVGDAMTKLKSGLAGELEPLRAIGYDLSQAKLEAMAEELGITKLVSDMTQAEKAQLRYYAIMTQVTVAQGDMARTLDDPANQLRVLKAQVSMAAREIGNVFIPALNAILPYAIAVVKVIRVLASNIAGLFGYEMPEMDTATDTVVENTDAVAKNLEESQKEAKKLKSYMMGFDELNVINPNEGSSAEDDPLGQFNFELPEYDFMSGLVESKVNEIVEDMKEWLGITEDIDSWSELFETRLGTILKQVGLIGTAIAAWKVTKTFMDSITALITLMSNPTYAIAISVLLTISGFTISFTAMQDAIREGLDGFNFAEIIGGALLAGGGAFLLGSKIATWITTAFSGSAVANALTTAAINLFGQTAGPISAGAVAAAGGVLLAAITGIILGIPTYFVGIYDACVEGIDWLSSLLIGAGATAAGAGIGAIIGMLGGPIGAGVGALIGLAVGLVTDLVILIVQKWDEISAWFKGIGQWIYDNVIKPVADFFEGLWEDISKFFGNLWDDIVAIWKGVGTWFDEKVIKPVAGFFEGLTTLLGELFEGCWIIIQAVWLIVSTWFNDNVITPLVEFFKGLWTSVSGFFSDLWEDIKVIWDKVSKWFNETVVVPVVEFFKGVWTSVSGFFSSLWEDIKEVWNKVSTWFDETIVEPVKTAFEKACEAIGGFFSSLWLGIRQGVANAMNGVIGGIESAINWVVRGINSLMDGFNDVVQWAADVIGKEWGGVTLLQEVSLSRIAVPTFADGGFPEQGQMFVAREAGAEMVGNIGRRTAVANNDQIVSGIAGGVAQANEEQNMLLREQNSLLRALLEKDNGVYLDGKNLTNSVEKYQRERGRVLIAGGVV